jgi:Domain of unknown function (DUF4145)
MRPHATPALRSTERTDPRTDPMPLILHLGLRRCPHCRIANPNLPILEQAVTNNSRSQNHREWGFYACQTCGGVVTAWAPASAYPNNEPASHFPGDKELDLSIPERARNFLDQAISSVNAPAGAVMLAASSVDAMLKAKNYTTGSLYSRIEKAAEDHLITTEMAEWAHEVRLDANDQRHADEEAQLPETTDAERVIAFATALAEFLFVLPARVQRGRARSQTTGENSNQRRT